MKTLFLVTVFLAAAAAAHAGVPGWENLPPGHWAYTALERFDALGLCDLPAERPFTRPQVIEFCGQIEERAGEELSPRDRYNLERLRREFSAPAAREDPDGRYDPPLWHRTDGPLMLETDLSAAFVPTRAPFDDRTDFFLTGTPAVKLHLDSRFTSEVQYALTFGPERGTRARDQKPSKREKSFKGLTSLYERSYLQFCSSHLTLRFGREYIGWGPSPWGNLLLSESAGSIDQLAVRLRFLNCTLSMVHGQLSSERERYLAAHRLEIRWRDLLVGVSESVIYAGRGFDPVYLLPVASYYANQFNEKGNADNILWSVDAKWRPAAGFLLYGGLLIDDFQFERDDDTPDKLGFDLGASLVIAHPVAAAVSARYRYVDIHTFTHSDSITAHVAGDGLPHTGDPLLGGDPGPDTDLWRLELRVFPRADLPVTVGLSGLRRGEGNDFREFRAGMDPSPPFPLGTVERRFGVDLTVAWEVPGGSSVAGSWRWQDVTNLNHVPGNDSDDSSFYLSLMVDL